MDIVFAKRVMKGTNSIMYFCKLRRPQCFVIEFHARVRQRFYSADKHGTVVW